MKKLNETLNSMDFALWGILFALNWKIALVFLIGGMAIMSQNKNKHKTP